MAGLELPTATARFWTMSYMVGMLATVVFLAYVSGGQNGKKLSLRWSEDGAWVTMVVGGWPLFVMAVFSVWTYHELKMKLEKKRSWFF